MNRITVALIVAGLIGLPCGQSALAVDNLFPDNLFPDDKSKPLFQDFNTEQATVSNKKPKADPAAAKQAYKEAVSRDDEQLRKQMQQVASWLQEFSLRNQNRFPGVYGSSGTIGRASEVQLTELVGANPYANTTGMVNDRELNGLSPGLANYYSNNGTPIASSSLANDEWTSELSADDAHRINLQMDQNASDSYIDQMRNDPPSSMIGAPGEITACGNGSGFIYVWASGIDGKPLKDYNGKPYIITAQTGNNVNDIGQEAGY